MGGSLLGGGPGDTMGVTAGVGCVPGVLRDFFMSGLFLDSLSNRTLPAAGFSTLPLAVKVPDPGGDGPVTVRVAFVARRPLLLCARWGCVLAFLLFIMGIRSGWGP